MEESGAELSIKAAGLPAAALVAKLSAAVRHVEQTSFTRRIGWVKSAKGTIIRANINDSKIGEICEVRSGAHSQLAEVVGFEGTDALLGPFGDMRGLQKRALIVPVSESIQVPVGEGLLGRVIGPLGNPIDGSGPLENVTMASVRGTPVAAMDRPLIDTPFVTGIKAIDGPNLIGHGQRVGIFGPPGVGKSNLLSALARHSEVDVIVIAMVGERAREVREFLDRHLPQESRQKVVAVASTSERPPMERLYAAHTANRVAEEFQSDGKSVLLLVDSLTRVARALREIGLSTGEPPTRRGYPASVYNALPGIIERAGRTEAGAVTALYTVLTEGEISEDPIAEEVRSLTDGHIILSRELAERSQYPAIDVTSSISRLMSDIASEKHNTLNQKMRRLLGRYGDAELLIQMGEYNPGQDAELDQAVSCYEEFQRFLRQTPTDKSSLDSMLELLEAIIE